MRLNYRNTGNRAWSEPRSVPRTKHNERLIRSEKLYRNERGVASLRKKKEEREFCKEKLNKLVEMQLRLRANRNCSNNQSLHHWFLIGVPRAFCKHSAKLRKSNFFFIIIITTLEEFYNIFQNIKFKYI